MKFAFYRKLKFLMSFIEEGKYNFLFLKIIIFRASEKIRVKVNMKIVLEMISNGIEP